MLIEKIIIKNYRSIENIEILCEDFNIFVGQNNHGKSNIFEAVNYFFNGFSKGEKIEDIKRKSCNENMEVLIKFKNLQNGINEMKNEKNKKAIQNILESNNYMHDTITINRINDEDRKISFDDGISFLEKNPTGFDKALNDLLPTFEFIDARKHFADVGQYTKNSPIEKMLADVVNIIANEDEKYKKLQEQFIDFFENPDGTFSKEKTNLQNNIINHLKKQFPDCVKVKFDISPPDFSDLLKKFNTIVDDGIETDIKEKGDGVQRALMLSIIQTYADFRKCKQSIKNFLFFIDEAELHLHPLAQRNLKEALNSISKNGDQVFINTNSSVLITQNFDNEKIFEVEKTNKITNIKEVINKSNVVFDLLGGLPTDLLFPNNFLIVEEDSMKIFIENIIDIHYKNDNKPKIQIINAKGNGNFLAKRNQLRVLYEELNENPIYKDRCVCLADDFNQNDINSNIAFNFDAINGATKQKLPTIGLEDYYPQKFKTKYNELIKNKKKIELAKKVANEITKEEFEKEMTIVFNTLEDAWKKAY